MVGGPTPRRGLSPTVASRAFCVTSQAKLLSQVPMPDRYAAFISYAHRYAPWVCALQANLEKCLAAAGRAGEVFLDQTDLGSGRSWVTQLQAGIDRSEHFILVATPEALASPRVGDEWGSFLSTRRGWLEQGRLHLVSLRVRRPPAAWGA